MIKEEQAKLLAQSIKTFITYCNEYFNELKCFDEYETEVLVDPVTTFHMENQEVLCDKVVTYTIQSNQHYDDEVLTGEFAKIVLDLNTGSIKISTEDYNDKYLIDPKGYGFYMDLETYMLPIEKMIKSGLTYIGTPFCSITTEEYLKLSLTEKIYSYNKMIRSLKDAEWEATKNLKEWDLGNMNEYGSKGIMLIGKGKSLEDLYAEL